jgi:protein-S-isoprenylcysteine O-methyltransferase Ste14
MMTRFKFCAKSSLGILFFILVLFISAGRIDYFQGWLYFSISFLGLVINLFSIIDNTELMDERSKPGKGIKRWDKQILGFSALLSLIMLVVAGLDSGRFKWSPPFQWYYYVLGIALMFIGQLLFLIAKKQNAFFSSFARIQTERDHTVCDAGIYRVIRHPGYLGLVISLIAFPLIIGSLVSIIPVSISIFLLLARTHLEDTMLMNELKGYRDYSEKTRYRLVPKLW